MATDESKNAETTRAPAAKGYAVMVLLVDDQAMIGEAVRRALLNQPNIEFHYCADPGEAIAIAEQIGPTVILQDLVMPGIDGLALVRQYRSNPATRDVPIVVLSSKEDPTVKSDAFAAGANDYLVKLPSNVELDCPHPLSLQGVFEPAPARRSLPRTSRDSAAAHGDEYRVAAIDERGRTHRNEQQTILQRAHGNGVEPSGPRTKLSFGANDRCRRLQTVQRYLRPPCRRRSIEESGGNDAEELRPAD